MRFRREQRYDFTSMPRKRAALHCLREHAAARHRRAAMWRAARAKLSSYPYPTREALRLYWQRSQWSGDPSYLLSMLHMYDCATLDGVPNPDVPDA